MTYSCSEILCKFWCILEKGETLKKEIWIWIVVPSCAKCGPAALESPETLLEIQSLSPWKAE